MSVVYMQFHSLWLNNTSILKHVQSLVWFIETKYVLHVDHGSVFKQQDQTNVQKSLLLMTE